MKVLLINGSPRQESNTLLALNEVTGALNAQGIETETVGLGLKPIRGCMACGACRHLENACIFEEDCVNEILEKAEAADGFVFGSPVYYASANGSLISLMDRLFYAGSAAFRFKPAAAVAVARRAGTTATLDQINKYFQLAQMPIVSSCYWNEIHGRTPGEAAEDAEGLRIMRTLGNNMAWLLKCIEAGRQAGINVPTAEPPATTNFIR